MLSDMNMRYIVFNCISCHFLSTTVILAGGDHPGHIITPVLYKNTPPKIEIIYRDMRLKHCHIQLTVQYSSWYLIP